MFGMSQGQMSQMARHLNAEHAQGVPSRLMQPPGGRPPSQPRVPIHLMMPHSTNMPGSGGSGASSRQITPHASASDSGLQTRARAAPTHVVPRYDVYGFVLKEPPSGDAARQLRTMDRGPEVPEHWARAPTHKGTSEMNSKMLSGLGHPVDVPPQSVNHNSNSEMQLARRRAQRPDNSYDIDGDGFVSQRDYYIAKRHDGRANQVNSYGTAGALTEAEQRAAIAEDMRRMDTQLPQDELLASLNGNRAHASLSQEPEMRSGRRGPTLTADRRNVTALWNRSSVQAKDCMNLPMEPPALLPGQFANTSSGLKKNRLEADTQRAQEQYHQYKATHPVPKYGFPTPAELEPGRSNTRTALLAQQRSGLAPHLSYDLDGDGYVSQADYRTAASSTSTKASAQMVNLTS